MGWNKLGVGGRTVILALFCSCFLDQSRYLQRQHQAELRATMMVGQACMKTSLVEGRGSGAVEERDKTKCT